MFSFTGSSQKKSTHLVVKILRGEFRDGMDHLNLDLVNFEQKTFLEALEEKGIWYQLLKS